MIGAMAAGAGYEERFRFPPEYARFLFVCAAFALASLVLPLPALVRTVELVVFGGGGLVLLALGLRGMNHVALRVDEVGLTLGRRPNRLRFTTELVPWADVRAVRLAQEPRSSAPAVLTVTRRGNQPPAELSLRDWKLAGDRFAAALAAHAPRVRFADDRSA